MDKPPPDRRWTWFHVEATIIGVIIAAGFIMSAISAVRAIIAYLSW